MGVLGSTGRAILRLSLVVAVIVVAGVATLVVVDWRARTGDEVHIVEVPYLGGSGAITTGRVIFVHEGRSEDAELLAHELVHVCQWEEGQVEFLWDYTTEYISNLAELRDSDQAYREISFEEEAREGDAGCDLGDYTVP